MSAHFADRLMDAIRNKKTAAVVGIDPVIENLPADCRPADSSALAQAGALERFGAAILEAVAPFVPAVKINSAFFECAYEHGVAAYFRLIDRAHAMGLLVIGDIKRGDIGSTARLYARGHIADPPTPSDAGGRIADAVTLAGYLGRSAVQPFVDAGRASGRGVFVLVRPSDPGADEVHEFGGSVRFYEHMAGLVRDWGAAEVSTRSGFSSVGAVVAAKDVESTRQLRAAMPNTIFLVPGYGAQGATAEACRHCFREDGQGAIVNASRSVIQAFENPRFRQRCGDDWRSCIREAARDFAQDIARICSV